MSNDKQQDTYYVPAQFKNIRYDRKNKAWQVLVQWKDYEEDEDEDTWEPAKLFVNDKAYECLIPDLLNAMKTKTLPDFNTAPATPQRKRKITHTRINTLPSGVQKCSKEKEHKSYNTITNIENLLQEDNKDYIKEGNYLHGIKCHKCNKTFVSTIKDDSKEITIKYNEYAWRCPNI